MQRGRARDAAILWLPWTSALKEKFGEEAEERERYSAREQKILVRRRRW